VGGGLRDSTSGLRELVDGRLARLRPHHVGLVVGAWSGRESGFWHRGRLPAGAASIFEIGSITKVFTATLLAEMAREGLVRLDDPVERHLPAGFAIPVRGRPVTLEDLASHRAGLPRLPKGLLLRALTTQRRNPYAGLTPDRLEAAVPRTRPRREPGVKFVYSNYGVGLLGHVLARRAGLSYEGLVQQRLCRPLALNDTFITPSADPRLATGHNRGGRPVPHWDLAALAGAGGLSSTAADLLSFLRLHAGEGPPALATAARMTQAPRVTRGKLQIGLGWLILSPTRRLPSRVLLHSGGTGGFRAVAAVSPERDIAVVALANQARSVERVGLGVLRTLLSRPSSG
jgi:D-alanyl-D-alanine-carboxypeptidase/D-alanyl-D-alanine-endopeptidase